VNDLNLFAQPIWLYALLALPLLALAAWRYDARRRARLARLIDAQLQSRMVRAGRAGSRVVRAALLIAALGATALALARPLGGETAQELRRSGRDAVFVIDVSRSMLAEDLAPNRLDRAKQIAADGLKALQGARVGVIAFAGSAAVKCPLTADAAFARLVIDDLDEDSVARGGSKVGDALRETIQTLFPEERDGRSRDVILISDGEDHGSFPIEAAAAVRDAGARLITIGLGRSSGAPVPAEDGDVMRYEGEPVISRLDSTTLERMARATEGGVFLPVGDGFIEFDRVYAGLAPADGSGGESEETRRRAELFQWPLGLALFLLIIERSIRER